MKKTVVKRHLKFILFSMLLLCVPVFFQFFALSVHAEESEEEPGSSAASPIEGTSENLITGEDGTIRYVGKDGTEVENVWVIVDDNTYYFDNTGRAYCDMLRTMDDKTYYFGEDSICKFGLVHIEDSTYFFTPLLGINVGWVSSEGDEDIYYFDEDGRMHTGFLSEEREEGGFPVNHYFDEDTGLMHTGWLRLNDKCLYFNEDGIQLFQWQELDGEWYYFQEFDEGNVARDLWWEKDGKRVYITESGEMARNVSLVLDGIEVRFDDDGSPNPDWLSGLRINFIYFLVFVISTVLVYFSSLQSNWKLEFLLAACAVLVLSVFAGSRNTAIGYDVSVYITAPFEWVENNGYSFLGFFKRYSFMEPAFNLVMYFSICILNSPNAAMLIFSLLTVSFVFAGLRVNNGPDTRWFGWLLFCLLFFNTTLHIVRQYIAVAILFYLFSDEDHLNAKRVGLMTLLAASFHYVGFIAVPLYLFYLIIKSRRIPTFVKAFVQVAVISVPPVAPYLGGRLLDLLVTRYPEVFWKYQTFAYGHEGNGFYSIDWPAFICSLTGLLLFILYLYRKQTSRMIVRKGAGNGINDRACLTAAAMDVTYSICSNKFNYRFQYMISIFCLEYYLKPLRAMNPRYRRILQSCLVIAAVFFWLYKYAYLNSGQTTPYLFWYEG